MEKLTPKKFLTKFWGGEVSMTDHANTNCLRDLACSSCGNRRAFNIEARATCVFFDDGVCESFNAEYDLDSHAQCRCCDRSGQVRDFHISGLDELIEFYNTTTTTTT
jgi:hypothetical protein